MDLYLPIAEMSVNAIVIILLGGGVGFLSGMFGVGGGFLTTPLLIFYGIPPAIAVASSATQITGSSVSGALAYWRRGQVDVSSRALSADLDALAALAAEALGAGEPGVVDRLLAAAAGVDDVGTALRVSGIAAILARWSGTRADEARAAFEREATRAETEPRRDVRAIRRALEAPPRSGCDLL